MPLIGSIQAAGRSEADLASEIAQRLDERYISGRRSTSSSTSIAASSCRSPARSRSLALPLTRDHYTLLDVLSEPAASRRTQAATIDFIPAGRGRAPVELASNDPLPQVGAGVPSRRGIPIDLSDLMRGGERTGLDFRSSPVT